MPTVVGIIALLPVHAIASEAVTPEAVLSEAVTPAAAPPTPSLARQATAADQRFRQAQLQHHKGHLEAALRLYTEAIQLNPSHVLAYVARGGILGSLENYDGAIADYNAALDLNPELAGAYGGRGLARYRSGETTAGAQDLLQAARLYRAQDRPGEFYSTLRVIQQLDP